MRGTIVLAVAGVLALALSIPLALVGRAALATPARIDRELTRWPADARVAHPSPTLAERAAARLVGAQGRQRFADLVADYRQTTDVVALQVQPDTFVRLAKLNRELRTPAERSQGLVMLGTLFALTSGSGGGVVLDQQQRGDTAQLLSEAISEFQAAVRADPTNEQAKWDLELLLRQVRSERPPPPHQGEKRRGKKASRPSQKRSEQRTLNRSDAFHVGSYVAGTGY